eukprot:7111933-Pyramimonas_sp.AAC.2
MTHVPYACASSRGAPRKLLWLSLKRRRLSLGRQTPGSDYSCACKEWSFSQTTIRYHCAPRSLPLDQSVELSIPLLHSSSMRSAHAPCRPPKGGSCEYSYNTSWGYGQAQLE